VEPVVVAEAAAVAARFSGACEIPIG
jgi:hypothetical protein